MPKRKSYYSSMDRAKRARIQKAQLLSNVAYQAAPMYVKRAGNRKQGPPSMVRVVKNMKEVKFVDIEHASAAANNSGTTTEHITVVAQGDAHDERGGNIIKGYNIEGSMKITAGAADLTQNCRVLLIADKMNDETEPVIADILTPIGAGEWVYALPNRSSSSRERFSFLYDKRFQVSFTAEHIQNKIVHAKFNVPYKRNVKYNSTAAANSTVNKVWAFFISDQAATEPLVEAYFRFNFVEV